MARLPQATRVVGEERALHEIDHSLIAAKRVRGDGLTAEQSLLLLVHLTVLSWSRYEIFGATTGDTDDARHGVRGIVHDVKDLQILR